MKSTVTTLTEHAVRNSKIQKVFYFYDEPVVYSCFCDDDRYLVLLVDENSVCKTWFYALIGDTSYTRFLKDEIDVYSAFKFTECGYVYKVAIDKNNQYKISKIPSYEPSDF